MSMHLPCWTGSGINPPDGCMVLLEMIPFCIMHDMQLTDQQAVIINAYL